MTTPVSDVATLPGTLAELETLARGRVEAPVWEYLDAGCADELTLEANRAAFDGLQLHPRVLRDVSAVDTALELFGRRLEHPILVAPTAYHRLLHPEGEAATARGAAAAGALLTLSTFSTTPLEAVAAEAAAGWWFQLYVQRDRDITRRIVERAVRAGAGAIVVTVDTPVLGARDRERRAAFGLPEGMRPECLPDTAGARPHTWIEGSIYSALLDPALTWQTIDWIRGVAGVPVVLKGILSPDDAARAATSGVGAVIVSNHGGRNLDTVPATLEALPGVVAAVDGRLPVLLDGGIRRGTDVVKALALGARAVLVGRPVLWGLAAGGAEGVRRVLEVLKFELASALALCGTPRLADVDRNALWTPPAHR